MWNKKMKKFAAAAISASLIFSASAVAGNFATSTMAEEETQEETQGVSLALAGGNEADAGTDAEAEEAKTDEETETETDTPVVYDQLETTSSGDAAVTAIDVTQIVEDTMPSIVAITATSVQEVESYFYGRQEIEVGGAGSGIIIAQNDTELLIATNNHIVDGAENLTVCFTVDAEDPDELLVPAVIKGTDSANDLAVVAVELKDIKDEIFKQLRIATLGSSDALEVGEASIVIGNALGEGQTVTTGIISALGRDITTEAGQFTELQTDAAINLGCSGGAILNGKGEVIAIVDAKATADYAESMGYGIPIDTAIPILQDLINRQTRAAVENHGYLGITVVPVSDEAKQMYNMPAGAFVYEVNEGSAGEKAGIKKGDIITRFDGLSITSSDQLVSTIGSYEVGETVKVEIQTADNGSYTAKEVEVTLQEGPAKTDADAEKKAENKEEVPQEEPKPEDGAEEWYEEDYGRGESDPFGFDDFGQFFFGDGFGRD